MFSVASVKKEIFSCLWKLFQCGNIQYALVPEHGSQFLYEFRSTGEVLELPYSSQSLEKRKRRLLSIMLDMAVGSLWLLKDTHLTETHIDWTEGEPQAQFHSVLASYIRFTVLHPKIAAKKGRPNRRRHQF